MPAWNPDWNKGRFKLHINYSHDFESRAGSKRLGSIHEEADFAEFCNEIAEFLKTTFPNIEIVANYDPP